MGEQNDAPPRDERTVLRANTLTGMEHPTGKVLQLKSTRSRKVVQEAVRTVKAVHFIGSINVWLTQYQGLLQLRYKFILLEGPHTPNKIRPTRGACSLRQKTAKRFNVFPRRRPFMPKNQQSGQGQGQTARNQAWQIPPPSWHGNITPHPSIVCFVNRYCRRSPCLSYFSPPSASAAWH